MPIRSSVAFVDDQAILSIDPFVVKLQSAIPAVQSSVSHLYQAHDFFDPKAEIFVDFHIRIDPVGGLRRFLRPQVQFKFDGKTPFKPLPYSQAFPFFEWGLNWCIANHHFRHLLLHAAVVEQNGQAIILPGQPGAGKSTLCAALVGRGWRLLSDEMAMIDLISTELIPIVRPVSLKNESIPIIKEFVPDVVMGESFHDTAKGTVSHMKPPVTSVQNATQRTKGAWVVFPQFRQETRLSVETISKAAAVLDLAKNAFNFNVLGASGFEALCDVVENCDCFRLEYSQLEEAVGYFANLAK
ncbi:MAG: HprK-related kinase A [Methylococcaceae bacterium]|nr:HprK-related kinase A [Methylococcaceae bacterium]